MVTGRLWNRPDVSMAVAAFGVAERLGRRRTVGSSLHADIISSVLGIAWFWSETFQPNIRHAKDGVWHTAILQ